ncbi:prolyl 3-hydroxylase 1 isoform X3 [Brachypodium distachyon]|uniref:prolyl 3-hydroxylase 1 isoform X3 n=1 Tax=Brachypodium distachyon TaxID=15368 RepID=UPI000D0D754E|nr:prolyl 3-hydroxylase 1 isoform X3 [Brachypodium distachyon]|eukprot:XP_024312703.1 prolyl 3-hydroxylase 1 isoform X3 [Brachypodium distachyon]
MAASPPPIATVDHPRLLLHGFLSPETCKELEFVHRSCGTAGYRPSVVSTSLPHLAATGCGHLLLPFVPIREQLRDAVESFFSCHFDLFVEFTGLISWCKGASIGWHSDDNKPYLRQRVFTAVCYLNNHGKDYKGGILRFQDGEPSCVVPVAGVSSTHTDVVIYTADSRNVHCVDEVTEGERLTVTLWFTRDSAYDEDPKLLAFLSQTSLSYEPAFQNSYIPLPASDNIDQDSNSRSVPASEDPIELLGKPLRVGRRYDVFEKIFANSLHALQVVQFYYWKAPELAARRKQTAGGSETVCNHTIQIQQSRGMKLPLPCDHGLAQTIFGSYDNMEFAFEWSDFVLAVAMWESYSEELKRKLSTFLPFWLSNETIFVVNSSETQVYCEGNSALT